MSQSAFQLSDTIVALATPPGRGGLGVIRISGPDARAVAAQLVTRRRPLAARRATFTRIRAPQPDSFPQWTDRRAMGSADRAIDTVVVTWFPGPASYTGEDTVEISGHGSPVLLDRIVSCAVDAGARLARPGEFTFRAFLNGRVDLIQAEAVADLIDAATPRQAELAFDQLNGTLSGRLLELDGGLLDVAARLEASVDFPDEGYQFLEPGAAAARLDELLMRIQELLQGAGRGRVIREGGSVAIAGRVNVGKSSIFNMLVGFDRAMVSAAAGTTRDMVSERVDVDGIPVTLVDTAGRRTTEDEVEREGVSRALLAAQRADATLVVLDGSVPLCDEDRLLIEETSGRARVVAVNKMDLPDAWGAGEWRSVGSAVRVSARTGEGFVVLREAVVEALGARGDLRDTVAVTNRRHVEWLREAEGSVRCAADAAREGVSEEFVLADLQRARAALEHIGGRRTSEDVLRHIFERFCIGK